MPDTPLETASVPSPRKRCPTSHRKAKFRKRSATKRRSGPPHKTKKEASVELQTGPCRMRDRDAREGQFLRTASSTYARRYRRRQCRQSSAALYTSSCRSRDTKSCFRRRGTKCRNHKERGMRSAARSQTAREKIPGEGPPEISPAVHKPRVR